MAIETGLSDDDLRWRMLRRKMNEASLVRALAFFRENDIEPLVIKGWAIGREYPFDSPRNWLDIDFCVPSDLCESAFALVSSERLKDCAVDIHRELRHLDRVPWEVVVGRAEVAELDGVPVRIPRAEDHFRILAVHWLTDGGAHRDRLWDFYYLLSNRRGMFDWEACLADAGPVRSEWLLRVVALTVLECGLATDDMPFASDPRLTVPAWMSAALQKEWNSDVDLMPLHIFLGKPKEFAAQIRKRLPPNPIQATVDVEGRMDNTGRLKYQVGSFLKRIPPFFSRVAIAMRVSNDERKH